VTRSKQCTELACEWAHAAAYENQMASAFGAGDRWHTGCCFVPSCDWTCHHGPDAADLRLVGARRSGRRGDCHLHVHLRVSAEAAFIRPVHTLTDRARAITEGEGDARSTLPYYGTAELYDLGQSVLAMGQTLQSRAGAIRAYTDHVTHELKSPLTTIAGAAELLEAGAEGRDKAQLIIAIVTASARMQALLDDLRRLTAARDGLAQGETQLS
jgi:signal transduction histidine kinase